MLFARVVTAPPEPSAFVAVTLPATVRLPLPDVSQTWPSTDFVPVARTMPPLLPASA